MATKVNSVKDFCPRCLFYQDSTNVCKKFYFNVKDYPNKFVKKCNGNYFKFDSDIDPKSIEETRETFDSGRQQEITTPYQKSDINLKETKNILLGIFRSPNIYLDMKSKDTKPSLARFFYCSFTVFALVPVVLLNSFSYLLEKVFPSFVDTFHDFSPSSIIAATIGQLVLGPITLWAIGWCMYGGLKVWKAAEIEDQEIIRDLFWYLGTAFTCLVFLVLGVLVFLITIEPIDTFIDDLIKGSLPVAGVLWLIYSLIGLSKNLNSTTGKLFLGFLTGALFLSIVSIPVSFLLQIIAFSF